MDSGSKEVSRREFFTRSGQVAAGALAAGALASCAAPSTVPTVSGKVIGANERVNFAVIGIRGKGLGHARDLARLENVRVKTLVDVDENLFADRVKEVGEIQAFAPTTEYDIRRVLDDKEIDAVSIATTNHWHSLATIWACQSGKHVYVEKPCSHNVWEGRKMVEAARRYKCLVQVGFQSRSSRSVRRAMKLIHDGLLGDVYMARGLCFKPRDSIGRFPDEAVPEGVHYDLWLGPAPERPFNRNRFHYNWHWHWDYGNGDIGNQGPHQYDIARWGLNRDDYPVKVHSYGGYYAFDSAQETPNTQVAIYEYADGKILQFEVRGLYTNGEDDVKIGNIFLGSKGWMSLDTRGEWRTFFGRKNEPGPSSTDDESAQGSMNLAPGGGGHFENFIYALRSGKREDLTSDIQAGHLSSSLPHLANISYRLKRELIFDGSRERFVGDKEADRMLSRNYRKPYAVPKTV
jgi:predicted dehydrogenase